MPTPEPRRVPAESTLAIADAAASGGIQRIHIFAWRDVEDVEAGGSERHAAELARHWTAAGLEVTLRTSFAQGRPPEEWRDGYLVRRRAGRYQVFWRAVAGEIAGRNGPRDAVVEIWNGVPFFVPLWTAGPRLTWVHHVYGGIWHRTLPDRLARVGEFVELGVAPRVYRSSPVVTDSESARADIVERLRIPASHVSVVPPGVDPRFTPGGDTSDHPMVLAVGRLIPVKRFDALIRALAPVAARTPGLELVIVGDGYERDHLREIVGSLDAASWVRLTGHVTDEELVTWYRSAWVLAGASAAEGWGMTVTEAAACGTPAVVTDIAGHRDAVQDGVTGLLAPTADDLADGVSRLLDDGALRERLGIAALERARELSWSETARASMEILAADARRRRNR
ncbi:MAG: glycosyltransferase family 4 protein [Acidimicrobiia bacterium]